MKRILILALLVLAVVALPGYAQQYDSSLVLTQVVEAGGTSNINQVITLTKYEDFAVQASFVGTAASTNGNVTLSFVSGVNGTLYETTAQNTVVLAANGATAVVKVQNITVGAVGYVKLTTAANAATAGTGTLIITVAKKPQREGK